MRTVIGTILFLILFSGCQKEDVAPKFEAHYIGTFTRMNNDPVESPKFSNVTIRFRESTFEGISGMQHYPAICTGTFTISQTKINIMNECPFTANFDWTLIFNGDYQYQQSGDSLRIWRDYANGSQDIYELKKQK